ncbi:MAG: type II secretion system F family protein [Candidatus Methanosuratincola sp.]
MTQVQAETKEIPLWMPQKSVEELQKIEAKKARERFRLSLRDQLESLLFARTNKKIWHSMPFFIMHILACSYAEVSSIELVRVSSRTRYGAITRVMKRIGALVDLGIELQRACEISRKDMKTPYLRDFLQRFSQIAKMGEDMITFLTKEYNSFMTMYTSEMERTLTRLKRFTEAYSAILSSSVLIVLILVFTSVLWGAGVEATGYVMPAILVIYAIFAFIFYVSSPCARRISPHYLEKDLASTIRLSRLVLKITVGVNLLLIMMLTLQLIPLAVGSLGAALSGLPALLIGYMGLKRTRGMSSLDERFPEFVTMLTTSLSTTGTSLTYAFREISRLDFGSLSRFIKKMYSRLEIGIEKAIAWDALKKEISSDLISIHSEAIAEANRLGAPAKLYGPLIANSSLFSLTLRRRVEETAALMKGIVVPMHPILCAIMGLIMAILTQFIAIFSQFEQQGLPVIFATVPSLASIEAYIYIVLGTLTFVNAFVLHEIGGEQEFDLTFYLGLFITTGWLTYFFCFTSVSAYLESIGLGRMINIIGA